MEPRNLLDEFLKMRDNWRETIHRAAPVIKGESLAWENNRLGQMKWFLHPALWDRCARTMIVFEQEIPPGGKSGKLRHQGGRIHYFLEGTGYTIADGKRYDWEGGDFLILPHKAEGTVHQHFNADSERPARFIAAEPNLADALGPDQGCGFEILEDASS
jgi:gentisate 1,2-dioxygenase